MLITGITVVCRADPAAEANAALDKLHRTPYRQRDVMPAMSNLASGLMTSPITEHAEGRTRVVSEIKHPSVGVIRTEQITIGSRTAVRTTAPVLLTKLQEAQRKLTVSSAKSLLRQIVSAASAVQTGGLSAASWIAEATRAAATIKSTAEGRLALERAMEGFRTWQLLEDDEDADMPDPLVSMNSDAAQDRMTVTIIFEKSGSVARYRRSPIDTVPGMDFHSVLTVDTDTGYPVAEENYMNGQLMMRSEFFDVGLPIQIEIPDCLK
jgi:hypothetical protein